MREILEQAIKVLEEERDLLLTWVEQSIKGGWSTHQVKPMKERATDLNNIINELKVKMHEYF